MKVKLKIQKIIKATKGKQGWRESTETDKSEVSFTILFIFYILDKNLYPYICIIN